MFAARRRRGPWRLAGLLLMVSPVVALVPASAGQAIAAAPAAAVTSTPYCGITWGSLPKSVTGPGSTAPGSTTVADVRAGRHDCYDRLVIDLSGAAPSASVRYVPEVLTDGEGAVVPLRGGARLQVVVQAPAYDGSGHPTYVPADRRELVTVTGYRTFRQVAWAGSFEGSTTIGLGVRARLPMRVFLLTGPGHGSRVVIDVAHLW